MQLEGVKTSKLKIYSVAIAYTLCIGFSFFGIKKCVPYADTLNLLCYRYVAALLGVIIWIAVTKTMGVHPVNDKSRPRKTLYINATFYILFMIFQILAMYFATSIEGAIVFSMVPIFAKIIGRIVLGEKSTKLQIIFVSITVLALMLLIILNATDINLNLTGMVIMTISCVFVACQTVTNRYIRGVFQPIEITATIAKAGAVIFIGAAVIRAIITNRVDELLEPLHHVDFIIWASFLGVGCILFTAMFMAYMLAHMEIIQSTVFNSASTLISIVAGALILGEPLYWYHYVCGILIIGGVAGISLAPSSPGNSGKTLSDDMNKER